MAETIFIRADASAAIGTGHVMRMTVLGRELGALGFRVRFLTRPLDGLGVSLIEENGFSAVAIDRADSVEKETALVSQIVKEERAGLIVDHRDATTAYLEAMKPNARFLVCLDDLANRRYPVDMVVNNNIGAETFEIEASPETRVLAGARFALVRKQFAQARMELPSDPGSGRDSGGARKLLLTFGGSDPSRQTKRFIDVLRPEVVRLGWEIHAVAGRSANISADAASRESLFVHRSVKEMAALMAGIDFCFTAGGSTVLELACLGVPAAVVVVADDQVRVAEEGEKSGAFIDMGRSDRLSDESVRETFLRLAGDEAFRKEMSRRGRRLVDGLGACRVAGEVKALFGERKQK